MKLKIWHKLALSIISIIAVVLVITMLLFQNSFKTGFLAYLNELDNKRINILERALVNDYQRFGSWNFLEVSPRAWRQYTHQAMQPPENKKPRRPPPRHRNQQRKPPPNSQKKLPGNPLEHFISVNPISKDTKKQNHLSLFSTSHQLIAGTQQDPKTVVKRPIKSDNKIIAYLYIKPFSQLKNELDQNFIDHQSQSFIKITLVALFLALIGAWGLATYFRKRIDTLTLAAHQLTSGNYAYQVNVASSDELGKLGDDLNHLGKTLEKNKVARQQWIADISHELRTPLSILRGELEALEDGIRPLNHAAVQSLTGEVKRLGKLVEDLYQLSLSDLGALNYIKEPVNIVDLLNHVATGFQQRFSQKNLTLSVHCSETSDLIVFADEQRLLQLFSNLLENSARYTDEGGETHIYCHAKQNRIVIKIEDSSPSVASDQLSKLFNRLYRVDGSRNSESGGAGLGLSIVKAIVEAHDGTIIAKHSSMGGLAITLELKPYER